MAQNDVRYQIKGGFFNGSWTGEQDKEPAISYDRVYDAEDMIQPYRNVVTDGIFAYEKVGSAGSAELEMCFNCTVNGTAGVSLDVGSGLIAHRWFELDHVENIDVADNFTQTERIDSLIVQCNFNMNYRAMYIIYRQGSANGAPALETDDSTIYEFRLWNIKVPSDELGGEITLEDMRGKDECPIVTGLLQQLNLQDRLDKFDEDVQDKLDGIDAQVEEKLSGYDEQFGQKIDQYDTQYNSKLVQYDSQFQQKLQTYDNSMTQIWAEWESLKAQIGSGGGGGTIVQRNNLTITRGYVSYTSGTVTITDYDAETDTVFVFINGLYANTTNDYSIDSTGVITFKNTISSGADIDWWKFRITQASGGGGTTTDTPPVQSFALSVRSYDGSTVSAGTDGSYSLETGVAYFVVAPAYAGTYRWETKDGSSWNTVSGETGVSVTVTGGEHDGIRCVITYEEQEYTSTELSFAIEISGTAEAPLIQIVEEDGYTHQSEAVEPEPEPTQKVATPEITVE